MCYKSFEIFRNKIPILLFQFRRQKLIGSYYTSTILVFTLMTYEMPPVFTFKS
jgi:hypothetical protein